MAWASLVGADASVGWQLIHLSSAGPLEVRAGRRAPDDAEAVIVTFPHARLAKAEKLPDGQGFAIERIENAGAGAMELALSRRSAGNAEMFADMACNVIGAVDDAAGAGHDEAKLLRVFIGRVAAWQEFMRKGTRALGAEAEIGLVGELAALSAIVRAGVAPALAIEAWLGPLDGLRDFEIGTGSLEVKTSLASAGFVAKIGSLEQLDDALRQPLFVIAAKLRQTENGASLPQLVDAMRAEVRGDAEAERLLADRLLAVGYFDAHAALYLRKFELASARAIEVGPAFPRLTSGNTPAGILKASYEIDLDKAPGIWIGVEDALKAMGAV